MPPVDEGAVWPVPVSVTVCGLPDASSTKESEPVRVPAAVGVKLTETAQLAPDATVDPQLLTTAKSPDGVMLVILSTSTPVLVTDTSCAGEVVLSVCAPNVSADGRTAMPEDWMVIGPVFVRWVDADCVDAADAVEIVSDDCAPAAPGVTTAGSNVQVVCGGRVPLLQLNVIGEL